MASSDDEGETFPDAVSEYYFSDKVDEPLSFSSLPIQWNESESSNADVEPVFLSGKADNGLRQFYQQVKAWKYDISTLVPEILVLSKDNHWIKLKKPRKSYETLIRSILISVHCLCFCKSKPEASGKSLRDYLSKVFSLYDIRPSEKDLIDHISFIREAIKRDDTLGKSKFLAAFLENPIKNSFDEDVTKPSFIVDDINGEVQHDDLNTNQTDDSDSDGEDVDFDVCAICDNGGRLTCCEGKCFRSFHGTPDSEEAQESNCESLRLTYKELDESYKYQCENCQYSLHQCAVCGELGCSDKSSNTQVFRCSSATCGHFYHPKCVAKLLQKNDKTEQQTLKEKIAAGEPFLCPAHKCAVCKQTENEKVEDLQFAICRRCPKSYHRKCLPRDIKFEHQIGDDDDDDVRAWDGLLAKSRALIYCLEHEIDPDLATPARTIIFRNILIRNTEQLSKKKPAVKVTGGDSVDPSRKKSVLESQQSVKKSDAIKPEGSSKKRAAMSSGSEPSKKKKLADGSKSLVRRSVPTKVKKPSLNDGQPSLGSRLFDFYTGTESNNVEKDETSVDDNNQTVAAKPQQTEVLPPLDDESKQRIMALVREASSSVTLDEVKKYHQGKVPSTHAHSSRVDKLIKLSKVEGSVEALNVALKKLEEGCSVQDAMAVCDPSDIDQLLKWKEKLRVYLAPFLHGMRYTSFGRHFTKVEKLEKIVDKLHWYIEDGDTVVDFCCGANDFSCLMKKRLDETGKTQCSYKNFDITRPKNDFNFEKRDWMTVSPRELPSGSQLVMGLNPPFGTKAALANKFVDHALKFKPKLIVLIVPPETERLDSFKRIPPYDMIWEDAELLSGRSFYLPGSADVNDKQMDQWNLTPPPLYLWSRPNWTTKHKSIAQMHGHIPEKQAPMDSAENRTKSGLTVDKFEIEDSLPVEKDFKTTYKAKKPKNKKRKIESSNVPETKSKQIIKEKGRESSSKKPRNNHRFKKEEDEAKAQKLEEARVPVEAQKLQNKRASVEASKREITQAPVEAWKLEKQALVEVQKHETRAPVEAQKLETRAPAETQKQETRALAESQKNETRAPNGAQKPELTRVPSREYEVQKYEKSRALSRDIEDQKPRVASRPPSRETEVQKPELIRAPSREIEVQKHESSRAPSREFEDQKPRVTSRAPSREFEDQKPRVTSREMETLKQEKTRVSSREFEAQKYENNFSSPHTREDKVHDTLNADFSFVDVDQRSDGKYKSAIDESTFSLQNDFGQSYDDYLVRKYSSPSEESYVGSAVHRRIDAVDPVAPPGFSARPDHLQYPPGYERVISRGPYFDEMGARSGGGYSMARHEPGLTRYGSTDTTPYNRTSTSATQRYAPRLDELNHVRVNNMGRSEIDEMSHLRMSGLGRPEQPIGSRGVGSYRTPVNGPVARMDTMGFAPSPYHPYQHN